MIRGNWFVVTPWEKDVIYHKRMVNFTGGYQAPFSCARKVSFEQAAFFVQPWKYFRTVLGLELQQGEIQTPMKLIPKLLLTSPAPRLPQKNPYEYFKSLELYFNSNVFPMEVEIERKKKGSESMRDKGESKLPPPSLSWGHAPDYPQVSTSLWSPLPFAPTGLIPSKQRSPWAAWAW